MPKVDLKCTSHHHACDCRETALKDLLANADRHLFYLSNMFEAYTAVGKEKVAIRKMRAPLEAAREAISKWK